MNTQIPTGTAATLLLLAGAAQADQLGYRITDLGAPDAIIGAFATLNNDDIVATTFVSQTGQTTVYNAGAWSDQAGLTFLGGQGTAAWDVMPGGSIVGTSPGVSSGTSSGGAMWSGPGSGAPQGLPVNVPGHPQAQVFAAGEAGAYAGVAGGSSSRRAFRVVNGQTQVLDSLATGSGISVGNLGDGEALGLAPDDAAVGWSRSLSSARRPTYWAPGQGQNPVDLGTLSNLPSAQGIARRSEGGTVVGFSQDDAGRIAATVWDVSSGTPTVSALALSGDLMGLQSEAFAIRSTIDQIVGYASNSGVPFADPSANAVIWDNGVAFDLNDLLVGPEAEGWDLRLASDINDDGSIVGFGFNPQGLPTTYLLTFVPAPGAISLFGGAFCLAVRRRRCA